MRRPSDGARPWVRPGKGSLVTCYLPILNKLDSALIVNLRLRIYNASKVCSIALEFSVQYKADKRQNMVF